MNIALDLFKVSDRIIDQDGRIGVITNIRPYDDNIVWVRPETHAYKTMHAIPGLGSQITIIATSWHIKPDGTLVGDWFDRKFNHINDKIAHKLEIENDG
jgi:hypothetical protein